MRTPTKKILVRDVPPKLYLSPSLDMLHPRDKVPGSLLGKLPARTRAPGASGTLHNAVNDECDLNPAVKLGKFSDRQRSLLLFPSRKQVGFHLRPFYQSISFRRWIICYLSRSHLAVVPVLFKKTDQYLFLRVNSTPTFFVVWTVLYLPTLVEPYAVLCTNLEGSEWALVAKSAQNFQCKAPEIFWKWPFYGSVCFKGARKPGLFLQYNWLGLGYN